MSLHFYQLKGPLTSHTKCYRSDRDSYPYPQGHLPVPKPTELVIHNGRNGLHAAQLNVMVVAGIHTPISRITYPE